MMSLSQCTMPLLQPPPKDITHLLAPFHPGYTPGPKPKAVDYEDGVEMMLLNAMHKYACLILTADAFPNKVKMAQWAEAMWQVACKEVGVQYECSVCMTWLVSPLLYYHTINYTES